MDDSLELFSRLHDSALSSVARAINSDVEYQASAKGANFCFDLRSSDSNTGIVFAIHQGNATVYQHPTPGPKMFSLYAKSSHWQEFFSALPKRPFQSYWGMLRLLGRDAGVEVQGNAHAFTAHARVWRIILDRTRSGFHSLSTEDGRTQYIEDDERDDDSIVGHYTWLTLPPLGKCKIFYETSGSGDQPILFLHTAGADSRQFHSLMLNTDLQRRCKMYAFDLPGHGRSFPGQNQYPSSYANSEDFYISAIGQFISKMNLRRVIVSGASMGGQVCLAVALRAEELDVKGVIPCEGCDYLPAQQAQAIYGLAGDESILNPERVCGMMSPTSPAVYKRLNWWIYSSQATNIFPGDLKFYFEGWDGRDRMHQIDTKICPVYMLTGEYDYSCSPDTSRATAAKIKGAVFEEMEGVGHFPMSENPEQFVPYFNKALDHICGTKT